ncbi:MAG: dihydrolipoamide acetyltransferase family protein [Actinomycetes bacterium]
MAEFRMPSLGADMDEGTLIEWLVKPGQQVRKGDVVAVVDTAKAAIEVECFTSGVVERLLVETGQSVPVGTPLAIIMAAGEPAAAVHEPLPAQQPAAAPTLPRPAPMPAAVDRVAPTPGRVTSPLVRKLAGKAGIDLSTLAATGAGGTVTRADLERAVHPKRPRISPYARRLAGELGMDLAELSAAVPDGTVIRAADVRRQAATARPVPAGPAATAPAVPAGTAATDRQAAMRTAIAALMARSKREIPHYYLTTTIDLAHAIGWLRERNRKLPTRERLVPAALLLKATALAALETPALNGFWLEDRFVPGTGVHLGVAISLRGGGLVAPAIHDAPELPLAEVMARLRDLVARARAGRLRGSEMSEPTLTVTNLGDQGVESVLGVIYPPQVALVGFGKVIERPWAVEGMLGVRPVVMATLSADHRATDGFTGARFLDAIDRLLQQPEEL